METPTTTLDARFSAPDAAATTWAEAVAVLEAAQLSWIVTVRNDGRPHLTPLVAVWLEDAIHFATGAEEQKALNLRANPHVSVLTGCNTWDHGLDVVIEGRAQRTTDAALLGRLADAWAAKWDGQWQYEVVDGELRGRTEAGGGAAGLGREALVFTVRPEKVLAFGKGTFSQTRHRL